MVAVAELVFRILATFPLGFFWMVMPGIFWAKTAPFHPMNGALTDEFRTQHAKFYGAVSLMGDSGADIFRMVIGLAEGFVGVVCFTVWADSEVTTALALAGCFLGGFITLNGTWMHYRFSTKYASRFPLLAQKHGGAKMFCGTVSTLHWIVFLIGMIALGDLTSAQWAILITVMGGSVLTAVVFAALASAKGQDPDPQVEELLKDQ